MTSRCMLLICQKRAREINAVCKYTCAVDSRNSLRSMNDNNLSKEINIKSLKINVFLSKAKATKLLCHLPKGLKKSELFCFNPISIQITNCLHGFKKNGNLTLVTKYSKTVWPHKNYLLYLT